MITLSSDFGSPYPAAMKGVILQQSTARLVDVSHDFPRGDVRSTAFWLREILPYFPPAVHLVVVDPGVGTDRAAIVLQAGEHVLVGPDNGVLVPTARRFAGEAFDVFEIDDAAAESATFHGRDVFAPAAAVVHDAAFDRLDALELLDPVESYVDLRFPEPAIGNRTAEGTVLVIDGFGNAITNVPGDAVAEWQGARVDVNGTPVPFERCYADVQAGEPLLTVGSHGNVELAVNGGRGDECFGVEEGSAVRLSWEE